MIYKQEAFHKSLTTGWLTLDPWVIYTLGGESEERYRFRALFKASKRALVLITFLRNELETTTIITLEADVCVRSQDAESSE